MIDFPNDETLMTCGLDAWPFAREECPAEFVVTEERLQARLNVDHFRTPPDYREQAPGTQHPELRMPFVRFPRWHYCPRCGDMRELGLFGGSQRCDAPNYAYGLKCGSIAERRRPLLVPSRFVAVCGEAAHIQDFPFMEWVHREHQPEPDCRLRIRAGLSVASLSGIVIECICGQRRTMAGAFNEDALGRVGVTCGRLRPWLGEAEGSSSRCGHVLHVVQRGGSNAYFGHVLSSIYLPLWAESARRRIVDLLEDPDIWSKLGARLVDGRIDPERCRSLCEFSGKCQGVDPDELLDAAQKKLEGAATGGDAHEVQEQEYRLAEYEALKDARGGPQTDLFATVRTASQFSDPVSGFFERVVLVHKLRETRAFCGFSRYLPDDPRPPSRKIADLRLDSRINWLPAIVVRGEGIFLVIDRARLLEWAQGREVCDRVGGLRDSYNRARAARGQRPRQITPSFVALHSLAHVLINQLSFECGYGSASLRERIYCDSGDADGPMNGILIYTASGDAEGTMGGLVRQGVPDRLEQTLLRALLKARWCSYDPICLESSGQGPDSCNLAACHGCALLPETSCEEGNRLLDRGTLVGLPDDPTLGLFGFVQRL